MLFVTKYFWSRFWNVCFTSHVLGKIYSCFLIQDPRFIDTSIEFLQQLLNKPFHSHRVNKPGSSHSRKYRRQRRYNPSRHKILQRESNEAIRQQRRRSFRSQHRWNARLSCIWWCQPSSYCPKHSWQMVVQQPIVPSRPRSRRQSRSCIQGRKGKDFRNKYV